MKIIILGGGLAGISLAYFLQDKLNIEAIDLFEKEDRLGGLCRSFTHDHITFDIGPHIFFSKDKEILSFMLDILGDNKCELRRSNRIIHKGRLVQYPFENDLSALPPEDCKKCVDTFIDNPYQQYPAGNMLQFFLKTFGEGITNLYLRPYNEKIWKFDPTFMDTQMVERIPRPPDEDILRSAAGETVDGYTHQLYFSYPKSGGTEVFISAFVRKLNHKVTIHTACEVSAVQKEGNGWRVTAGGEVFNADTLFSCMPVNLLTGIYADMDENIALCAKNLHYNHIMIAVVTLAEDRAGDNFAFMVADREVIFHRVSKLDFLGENYRKDGSVTYMMEYTYRDDDPVKDWSPEQLKEAFLGGLQRIGFLQYPEEVLSFTVSRFPYAYVIYDLDHNKNMSLIRKYFSGQGVYLNGRFGTFEYWNMDRVVVESKKMAEKCEWSG